MNEKEEHTSNPAETEPRKNRSDAFGHNLLGVVYIAPDFYDDLPLEDILPASDQKDFSR
jgi:hypothetical protein